MQERSSPVESQVAYLRGVLEHPHPGADFRSIVDMSVVQALELLGAEVMVSDDGEAPLGHTEIMQAFDSYQAGVKTQGELLTLFRAQLEKAQAQDAGRPAAAEPRHVRSALAPAHAAAPMPRDEAHLAAQRIGESSGLPHAHLRLLSMDVLAQLPVHQQETASLERDYEAAKAALLSSKARLDAARAGVRARQQFLEENAPDLLSRISQPHATAAR